MHNRAFVLFGNPVQQIDDKARHRIVLVIVNGDPCNPGQPVQRVAPFDQPVAGGNLNQLLLDLVVFVLNVTYNLLDQILDGQKTRRATIFVDDDGHLYMILLHLAKQITDVPRFRGEPGGPHDFRK